MKYIVRWMEARLKTALEAHPVAILTGPRQVGKSTLLQHAEFLQNWRYITLDDPDSYEQAKEDPKGLLLENRPTIIDEIQRCPNLLITIKYLVDKSEHLRKFILSGSGNISSRKTPRETLAGRTKYLHLTGFSFREMHSLSEHGILSKIWSENNFDALTIELNTDINKSIWRGSLPGIVLSPNETIAIERLSSYIDTYIQRDIQDLVKINHPEHFRQLMQLLAQATGWESVQQELSNACGETRTNISRYISLLKDTNLLYAIRGFSTKNERAYKQSKYYWFDSGTACFLSGLHSSEALKNKKNKGKYFENFILQQILSWASLQLIFPQIYYWKSKTTKTEVDFIISSTNKAIGIEVKSSPEITFRHSRQMREFLKNHPQISKGIIVYTGKRIFPVASNILAVPWTAL